MVNISSPRDNNRVPALIATSNADGVTPLVIFGDSVTNRLLTNTTVSGTVASALQSGTPLVGQYKITASAVQLSSVVFINGVIITAKVGNAGNVLLGGSSVTTTADGTGNGYILSAGSSVSFAIANLNQLYAIGTANDVISWAGC